MKRHQTTQDSRKKLALDKRTLRELRPVELEGPAGGAWVNLPGDNDAPNC